MLGIFNVRKEFESFCILNLKGLVQHVDSISIKLGAVGKVK